MVRQRMTKKLLNKAILRNALLCVPFLGLLSSCNPTELTAKNAQGFVVSNNDGSLDGKAYVYKDSPYILAGPNYSPIHPNMGAFTERKAELITTNTRLTGNCEMMFFTMNVKISECIHSLSSMAGSTVPLPRNSNRTYIFDPNSDEFYQVNALYHVSQATKTFLNKLSFAYEQAQLLIPFKEPKSIPYYLMNTRLFWFKAMSNQDRRIFNNDFLATYALCEQERNASFTPAGPSLCFGKISELPGFLFVQDPSVIYHEFGHAAVSIMMNLRNGLNGTTYHPLRSSLGGYGYDEAGSLNEGIADYFSYMMNKRERVGEFALGRTVNQSRPVSEADTLHSIPGIEETSSGRLSYPQYLNYDPNSPDEVNEAVHYAGQIVSHYLVALTKTLKYECGYTSDKDGGHDRATSIVMLLLAETLSELGDLYAKGIDNAYAPLYQNAFFTNLNESDSYLWTHYNNPVTYRRFFQTFAKNINKYISHYSLETGRVGLCPTFDKNKSERLLDDYGLLLFKSYNDNGTSTTGETTYSSHVDLRHPTNPTAVQENNRRKSVLISKQLIQLATKTDEHPSRVSFYIVDTSSDMEAILQELLFKGFTIPLSNNVAGTRYNNNNIKISPGEVIAVIPNLQNNSNSTMAGVQILATDWDHVHIPPENRGTGNFKPCVIPGDSATTVDQGAEPATSGTCKEVDKDYKRLIQDPVTKLYPEQAAAPVCMVLLEEGNSSRWVSQNEFRKKQGLSLQDKDCLGYSSTVQGDETKEDFSFSPHECLVRFLPGANTAYFSKIDAQKTYYETIIKESGGGFNMGNAMIMEVNKWIPPGTKFRCRMRVRFSNCSDCYTDGSNGNDDFPDYEYNGYRPYKIINFDFDVND